MLTRVFHPGTILSRVSCQFYHDPSSQIKKMYVARGRFSGPGVNLSQSKIVSLMLYGIWVQEFITNSFDSKRCGLLGTSTFSPSWTIETLVPILKVVADVKVFVHGLRGWWANFWDAKQQSQDVNEEFENPGRRGRRYPAEACSKIRIAWYTVYFIWLYQNTFTRMTSRLNSNMISKLLLKKLNY